jgi:two-component system sensor histidine kinase/response regulator
VKLLEAQASLNQLTIHKQFLNTTPHKLLGDPGRIRLILINLIGNAIKFSEKGGVTVCLNTDMVSKNSALVLIQVIDEGISVPKNELEFIFEAFAQAEVSTTRQFGGKGLGLTISRQIVEMRGGTIGVENNSGPGSTF